MSQKKTIDIQVPENLLNKADDCAEERGFDDLEHFIVKAIRDAVNTEDPFTAEAREKICEAREKICEAREKIREDREDDDWVSLEEVKKEIEEEQIFGE